MRKETIIKYEKEFLAWCKDESVLLGAPASMHDKTLIWREVRDFNDLKPLDTVYVLNDSYSDYRKALAEGKIVQEQDYFNKQWRDMKTDNFHGASKTLYEGVYRIKPEEPKFKVGDWVVHPDADTPWKLTQNSINHLDNSELKLWQPKPGEFCWFWNESKTHPTLATFTNKSLGLYYSDISNDGFDFCEPFIGQLPTTLGNCK